MQSLLEPTVFRFVDLPIEIRLQIYSHLETTTLRSPFRTSIRSPNIAWKMPSFASSILLTSKQICSEAKPVMDAITAKWNLRFVILTHLTIPAISWCVVLLNSIFSSARDGPRVKNLLEKEKLVRILQSSQENISVDVLVQQAKLGNRWRRNLMMEILTLSLMESTLPSDQWRACKTALFKVRYLDSHRHRRDLNGWLAAPILRSMGLNAVEANGGADAKLRAFWGPRS